MIIAVDFDGTILNRDYHKNIYDDFGQPVELAVETIKLMHELGHTLILWTCREGLLLEKAILYLNGLEIRHMFTCFNDNVPAVVNNYGVNSRKIIADMYIDDLGPYWIGWRPLYEKFLKDKTNDVS